DRVLNTEKFRTLSEAGFIPPLGPGSSIVTVQGLDGMQDAFSEIAGRFRPPAAEEGRDGRRDLSAIGAR
ncbi:MAG: hypothetical protein EOO66_11480, partial [Methylobacterium sp.]